MSKKEGAQSKKVHKAHYSFLRYNSKVKKDTGSRQ